VSIFFAKNEQATIGEPRDFTGRTGVPNAPLLQRSLWSVATASALGASLLFACSDSNDHPNNPDGGAGGTSTGGSGGKATGGSGGKATGGSSGAGAAPAGGSSGAGPRPDSGAIGGAAGEGGTLPDAGDGGVVKFDGRDVFRHDTFKDESFWTKQLRMHEVIQSAVDPTTALAVGLKVDSELVPAGVLASADLKDPATTVALIKLGAVVGIEGRVDDSGNLLSVGVTCGLCHSTVDDSVMKGIGKRLDGYANRDLDPGKIIALSPALPADAKAVLNSWGPGRYDARWNQDGKNAPTLIPPIYGLRDVLLETYTGDGPISYWNSYVAVTQMGGQGQFFDPRIGVSVIRTPDVVTPKLPALYEYEISLVAPKPSAGSFDAVAGARGKALFEGKATCSSCHSGPAYTDVAQRLHDPTETGMDPTTAERSATKKYRTAPLRALFQHAPYFHDGSAATLPAVVEHYDTHLSLALTLPEKSDLVEYLKSL